jgi:hypothetical protein
MHNVILSAPVEPKQHTCFTCMHQNRNLFHSQVYDVTLSEPLEPKQAEMLIRKFASGFTLVGESSFFDVLLEVASFT